MSTAGATTIVPKPQLVFNIRKQFYLLFFVFVRNTPTNNGRNTHALVNLL